MSEGEDAGGASDGCAGGLGQVLHRAGGGLGVGTVSPVVGHHSSICINLINGNQTLLLTFIILVRIIESLPL